MNKNKAITPESWLSRYQKLLNNSFSKLRLKNMLVVSFADLFLIFVIAFLQLAFFEIRLTSQYNQLMRIVSSYNETIADMIMNQNQFLDSILTIPEIGSMVTQMIITMVLFLLFAYVIYALLQSVSWYFSGEKKTSMIKYFIRFFFAGIPFAVILLIINIFQMFDDLSVTLLEKYGDTITASSLVPSILFYLLLVPLFFTYSNIFTQKPLKSIINSFKQLVIRDNIIHILFCVLIYLALNGILFIIWKISPVAFPIIGSIISFPLIYVLRVHFINGISHTKE
ncbi:hypothetical protein K9M79_05680 [Candidatus Woesearchaeota archaeon]|nr:hypothetical protein [Candidatus Woesearchaeota archaeon]